MGWAGTAAKLLLTWLVLRGTYDVLLTPDQREATHRSLLTNARALALTLRGGRPPPGGAHWEPDGGPMADAVSGAFGLVFGAWA